MVILLCGGGTGGHITPLIAVGHELKKLQPNTRIVYVGERGSRFRELVEGSTVINETHYVSAGKFRRYHGEPWLRRLSDIRTIFLNIRDVFRMARGLWQSYWLLGRIKPEVIFIKGGFVGVPIGLAARLRKIPFMIHDSDTVPGLANKIIGRYAAAHATGMPTEFYPGSKTKLHYTGIPLTNHYQKVSFEQIKKYRKELGLPEQGRVVLVTGGSLGAERLNNAFAAVASTLLEQNKDLHILHQVGKGNLEVYSQELRDNPRLHAQEFMMDLYRYSGAADVIVTRGGANTLAELALQHKACIVIPNPELTGGHQTKNAEHLKQAGAVVVIIEKQLGKELNLLVAATQELLDNPKLRGELAHNLSQLAKPTAAYDLATILLSLRT